MNTTNNYDNRSYTSSAGIGFPGLLAIVFIVLKLTGVITWPWLWVLSPLWICAILWVVIVVVIFAVAVFLAWRE